MGCGPFDVQATTLQRRRAQAAVLEEIAPDLFDGDLQIEVIRRVAELYRRELGDPERAREFYKKAVELRADDTASLVALEELYAEADDAEHLLDILQRRGRVLDDVVDERRRYGHGVEMKPGKNLRDFHAMDDVVVARMPFLPDVRLAAEFVRAGDHLQVQPFGIRIQRREQLRR